MAIDDVTEWMLDQDPALKWQVERDLVHAPASVWEETRARVATEGMGARLLALQDPDGQWARGAYFPGSFDFEGPETAEGAGQPWTATTWTLNTLRDWGLDPTALAGTAEKLAVNSTWEYNDGPYWEGEVDCCINAFTLANGAWLGADVSIMAAWFPEHVMSDGGWNCEWENGSVRSSFASTLNSLKGILYHEAATGGTDALRAARRTAEEYLLERKLLYRLTTGEPVAWWVDKFVYPFRHFYTALKSVDYFREKSLLDGTAPDPRMAEAVEVIRAAREPDGTWIQQHVFPGRVWFDIDVPPGEPSPWLTFYGTRVLEWWDGASVVE